MRDAIVSTTYSRVAAEWWFSSAPSLSFDIPLRRVHACIRWFGSYRCWHLAGMANRRHHYHQPVTQPCSTLAKKKYMCGCRKISLHSAMTTSAGNWRRKVESWCGNTCRVDVSPWRNDAIQRIGIGLTRWRGLNSGERARWAGIW